MCGSHRSSVRCAFFVLASVLVISGTTRAQAARARQSPSTAAVAAGNTIHVPQDQPTIQAGVDAAVDGDQVVVAGGNYTGSGNRDIDFHGKRIVLRAESGAQVVIDCGSGTRDPHRGFYFHSGEGSDSVVEGIAVGSGTAGLVPGTFLRMGGGAVCVESSPTFRECIFKGGVAEFGGGGVACSGGAPKFVGCSFLGNDVPLNGLALGGGGLLLLFSSPKLQGCTFEGNTSLAGGAFFCQGSAPTVSGCTFRGNHPRTSSGNAMGGAFYSQFPSSPVFVECVFVENSSGQGGAIWFTGDLLRMERCLLDANSAGRGSAIYATNPVHVEHTRFSKNTGSAVFLDFASGTVFTGNEFVANVAGEIDTGGAGGAGGALYARYSTVLIEDNLFESNRALGASSARGGAIYTEASAPTIRGNVFTDNAVEVDPQFPNSFSPEWEAAGGALYLDTSNPLLGGPSSGGNTFLRNRALVGADVFKNGGPAVVDARSNTFTIFPVSSYYLAPFDEFDASVGTGLRPALTADVTVSPSGVDVEGAPGKLRTLDFALSRLAPTAGNVVTIHLDPGTYAPSTTGERFPVKMIEHARIVGAGPDQSVVDAEGSDGVIFCFALDDAEISNLRVTGGFAAEGGGILCRSASPLIQGNRIDGNSAIWGGGIACMNAAHPIVHGNEIIENSTLDSPYFAKLGGGVVCFTSSPVLEGNVIARNSSHDYGGGVLCNAAAHPSLVNDTIADNQASTGGGVTVWSDSHPTLTNCILWDDSAFSEPEISECCGATAVAAYSDVEGSWTGTGNLLSDPLFVDAALGDYRLSTASPCIDTGDPSSALDPDGTRADIGALPYYQAVARLILRR